MGQYFNWITSGPQSKIIKQKLSNRKYISLKKKNYKYIYINKTKKSKNYITIIKYPYNEYLQTIITIRIQFYTRPFPILYLESALPIYELQCASVAKFSQIKGFYNRTPPSQRFMQCWIRCWHSHFENGRRGMTLAHSEIYHFQHNKLQRLKLVLIKITLVKKTLGGLPQASFR